MYMQSNEPINNEERYNMLATFMGGAMALSAGHATTNYYGMKQVEHTKSDRAKMSKDDFVKAREENSLQHQFGEKLTKVENKLENTKGIFDEMKMNLTGYNDVMDVAIQEQKQYKSGFKKTLASAMSTTGKRAAIAGAAGLAGGAITYLINK